MFESNTDFEIQDVFQEFKNPGSDLHFTSNTRTDSDFTNASNELHTFKRPEIADGTKHLLHKIYNIKNHESASKLQNKSKKLVVRRKFPGPAGLLSDTNVNVGKLQENYKKSYDKCTDNETICSQNSSSTFDSEPWLKMQDDFQQNLFKKYTIDWIKRNNSIKQKAPFLAAMIKSIFCTDSKTPTFILIDNTGEIPATIVHDLYEEFCNELTVGSVIILRQFGVLATSSRFKHCITITPNNLVRIYTDDKMCKSDDLNQNKRMKVKIITIQDISPENMIQNNEKINFHKTYDEVSTLQVQNVHKGAVHMSNRDVTCDLDFNFDDFNEEFNEVNDANDQNGTKHDVNNLNKQRNVCKRLFNNDLCNNQNLNKKYLNTTPVQNSISRIPTYTTSNSTLNFDSISKQTKNTNFKFSDVRAHSESLLDLIVDTEVLNNCKRSNFNYDASEEWKNKGLRNIIENAHHEPIELSNTRKSSYPVNEEHMDIVKKRKLSVADKIKLHKPENNSENVQIDSDSDGEIRVFKSDTSQKQTIDCSQVSAVGKTVDCGVLQEIFCDLDASLLFDDF